MKTSVTNNASKSARALSLVEVLIVLGVLALLGVILLPVLANALTNASRITCQNNLKQVGLAFNTWALDHNGNYPTHMTTNRQIVDVTYTGVIFPYFRAMSNELGNPKILYCPAYYNRTCVTNLTDLSDTNISYFLNLDAVQTEPDGFLCGDANLTNQPSPGSRVVVIAGSATLAWGRTHNGRANLLRADGSVPSYISTNGVIVKLRAGITNRLAMPQ